MIWVVNVEEEQLSPTNNRVGEVVPAGDRVLTMTLALEAEAASLDTEDLAEMRDAFGLGDGAAGTISEAAQPPWASVSFTPPTPGRPGPG